MEINVPVREADAALIPGLFSGAAPIATVSIKFAGKTFLWAANVSRVAPNLDVRTRTLAVTVELNDIAGIGTQRDETLASGAPPAMINSFAKVVIQGIHPDDTFPIPSTALHAGKYLWLFAPSDTNGGILRILETELIHVDGETSYVTIQTLPAKSRLITTALLTAQEGMRLQDVRDELLDTPTQLEQVADE
jgi:hypothetical protein